MRADLSPYHPQLDRLLDGDDRAESLRHALLGMKARKPDPVYWGAFICQGGSGPLVRGWSKALAARQSLPAISLHHTGSP